MGFGMPYNPEPKDIYNLSNISSEEILESRVFLLLYLVIYDRLFISLFLINY
jgi:hypothetical protein